LAKQLQREVKEKFGVSLVPEVQLVGYGKINTCLPSFH